MENNRMISVVLPVFNRIGSITGCINQLLNCPEVCEVLVADGGSTDGTVAAIEALDDPRVTIVSRTDSGIYDAANKAIAKATGPLLWFMNSDDLASPAYAAEAARVFAHEPQIDFVYGNIVYGATLVRPRLLKQRHRVWQTMPFPHVSLIIRTDVHTRDLGRYDVSRAIGGDLDYLNRLMKLGLRSAYIDLTAATCAPGGVSTTHKQIWEARSIAIQHGKSRLAATVFAIAVLCLRVVRSRPFGRQAGAQEG
jgi:glycosyltransferase